MKWLLTSVVFQPVRQQKGLVDEHWQCIWNSQNPMIPLLLTACICMVTGIRSLSHRSRRRITLMLAKQLGQPVLAIAESCTGVSCDVGGGGVGGGGCIPVLCSLQGGLLL